MNQKELRIATFALVLANFMGGLDSTIINTALPSIMSDLQGIEEIGLLTSIFISCSAITTVLWGKIGEIVGNKKAFQFSVLLFVVASALGEMAINIWWLIGARALMGIGTGGMTSIPYIIYAQIYPDNKERAKALGYVITSFGLSIILGPVFGGWLVDQLNWHWVFYINLPIGLLSILLIQFFYNEQYTKEIKTRFDYRGATALIISLSLLLITIENISYTELWELIALVLLTILAFIIFWFIEKRTEDPIIPHELMTDFPYMTKNFMMFLIFGVFIGYSIYAPMWAQNLLGTSGTMAGATQISTSITWIVAAQLCTTLFNRFSFQTIV